MPLKIISGNLPPESEAERNIIVDEIRRIQERHRLELEPYAQMLALIEGTRSPPMMFIDDGEGPWKGLEANS
jgi:hypothetical protein